MPAGTVILAGGGETAPEIAQTLARLCANRPLVVLAHTQSAVGEGAQRSANFLKQHGAAIVHAPDTDDAQTLLPLLAEAQGVWIPGGDQNRWMEHLSEPVREAVRAVYRRGGVVGGTSAGASLMGTLMPTGQQSEQKPLARGGCTLAPALGILPTVLVDQHFLKRQRLLRMLGALLEHPHLTGIGIDEDGWAIVHNRSLTVKAGQVVIAQIQGRVKSQEELLGCDSVRLRILLPGERWHLPT